MAQLPSNLQSQDGGNTFAHAVQTPGFSLRTRLSGRAADGPPCQCHSPSEQNLQRVSSQSSTTVPKSTHEAFGKETPCQFG
jgi:hypothetical protein